MTTYELLMLLLVEDSMVSFGIVVGHMKGMFFYRLFYIGSLKFVRNGRILTKPVPVLKMNKKLLSHLKVLSCREMDLFDLV